MLESLQDGNFPFPIQIDKEKTNGTRFLSRKLDLIRKNYMTKLGLSIH